LLDPGWFLNRLSIDLMLGLPQIQATSIDRDNCSGGEKIERD